MKFPFSLFEKKSGNQAATEVAKPSVITPSPAADILSPPEVQRPVFQVPGQDTSPPSSAAPEVVVAPPTVSAEVASQVIVGSETVLMPTMEQMETNLMTQEDIIAAYKIFLRRRPENMDGVTPRVGLTADRILFDYLMSDEFTGRPEVAQLVFNCAKKILDAKKAADEAAAGVTGAAVPAPTGVEATGPAENSAGAVTAQADFSRNGV
jgi:hypothetical protein